MRRVAVVASHPIQYQAPWFRALAQVCDLSVWFCHRQSAEDQGRAGFGQAFDWDVPLLEGYHHEWLNNVAARPDVSRYAGCDTPEVADRLAQGRFDACIVNGWYLKSYLQAIRASRALGTRVLVRGDSHLRVARSRVIRIAKYFPYRWLLNRVDAYLVVGRANREYLEHYGVSPSRMFFAPHFVDNDRFADAANLARSRGVIATRREQWGASTADTVFLYAGKLLDLKRVGDFIAAIAAAHRQHAGVRGAIVGSGPAESALRALSRREAAPVVFAGFSNQQDMPACYAAADCLVLPSATESWGLVVNEAMASGLPAIVSDRVGAGPDLIEDGVTGHIYPMGDLDALTTRILAMRADLQTHRAEIRLAVDRRISRYSCANAVAGTLEALEGGSPAATRVSALAGNGHV
jgi:glycosyltransferase involved in cell wall biosynthesis